MASSNFLKQRLGLDDTKESWPSGGSVILGGGEGSGPLFANESRTVDETHFSCEQACNHAFAQAQVSPKDIDFFGLYDCFPICFIRALEAVKLAEKGQGGTYVEKIYTKYMQTGRLEPGDFPVNTHGGLLAFGAPWEVPAMLKKNSLEIFG